jgi:hypothetical protein
VYLDSTDATHINKIITNDLVNSECLVLMQTKRVLERPWVLMELCVALRLGLPIVCVNVTGLGYEFAGVKNYLGSLEAELDARNPGAAGELRTLLENQDPDFPGEPITSIEHLSAKLIDTIPAIIAIPFDPQGSDHHLSAVASEVVGRWKARKGDDDKPAGGSRHGSSPGSLLPPSRSISTSFMHRVSRISPSSA